MGKFTPTPPVNPPPQKPEDVFIQDFIMVSSDGQKFFGIGTDERIYFYNFVTHLWYLL